MTETRVTVDLGLRSYDVVVGEGLIDRTADVVGPSLTRPFVAIVTDAAVAKFQLPRLQAALARGGIRHETIIVPAGEDSKSFAHLENLLERLLAAKIERRDTVLALGGGVVGDLAGFAASILRRGVAVIQIPTTLLAQVDSAIGGKTAINSRQGKNLIGTFHQPRLVVSDVSTLETLPRRELLAGYAEVVKYGLIDDAPFFRWLETTGPAVLAGEAGARREAVVACSRAKARFVALDERETSGARALLNLGHTFGHAIEAEMNYDGRVLHGEAVAIGMAMAFDASVTLGLCPAADAKRVKHHLATSGLPTTLSSFGTTGSAAKFIRHIAQDKKTSGGRTTFVLVRGIGQAFLSGDVEEHHLTPLFERALAA
ncbi:MAG: 3-dehydroquinate synthase [Alphaproteobacteria bacterium]|nr:3-dehydroquinate synthase [Alphaproteobacteria bacterium]